MEYVFGNLQKQDEIYETVRTKGQVDDSVELSGYNTIERSYDDNIITDTFVVVEKIRTATDEEGNVYNWYIIKDHSRYIDKFTPSIKKTEREITDIELEIIGLKLYIQELQEVVGIDAIDDSEIFGESDNEPVLDDSIEE